MKRLEASVFFGGVVIGALIFAACGPGSAPPPESAVTPVNPIQPSDATDSPTPESQSPSPGPAGPVHQDDAEKSPSPGGSGTPAVGYP